jgi:hypothetical protein
LQTDVSPFPDGLKAGTSFNEGLCEIATTGSEGVGADCDRSSNLICFEKLNSLEVESVLNRREFTPQETDLGDREEVEKLLREVFIVAVVALYVGQQLLQVFRTRSVEES